MFKAVINSIPQMVWISDAAGKALFYNEKWRQYTGMNPNDLKTIDWKLVIHPDDMGCLDTWATAIRNQEPWEAAYRLKRARDGAYRWHLGKANPKFDSNGQLTNWYGTCTDIDDQKRLQNEHASTLKQLSDVQFALDASSIVAITDRAGKIIHANDKFCEISGYRREELLGQTHQIVNSGYHPKIFFTKLWATITSGAIWRGEVLNRAKDGSEYWVDTIIVPSLDQQKRPVQYIAIRTDITQRKREEAEYAGVRAREEAARQASEMKSKFLANMSHEIRTPLNAMIGTASLLKNSPLDRDQRENVDMIQFAGEALLNVVTDILDFSKIEAGKLTLESHPFEFSQIFDSIRGILSYQAKRKGLQLEFEIAEACQKLYIGDGAKIQQVLLNLAGNAVKFTPQGSIHIRAYAAATANTIRFEVEDNGIGIPAESLGHLFQPFEQGDMSTTRRFGGSGLGLAICKSLVEKMGGQIVVESEPGRGSKFSFELKLAEVRVQITDRAEKREVKARKLNVLVAEDQELNQNVISKMLKLGGHSATIAASGRAAIAELGRQEFDVLLLDCHMPEMDGFATAEFIRNRLKISPDQLPIIAITADVLKETVDRCFASGMNAFLSKPLKLEKLLSVLDGETSLIQVNAPVAEHRGVIDHQVIGDLEKLNRDSDNDIVIELYEDFMRKIPEKLQRIQNETTPNTLEFTERESHGLKSTCHLIGLTDLGSLFAKLEKSAKSRQFDQSASFLAEVQKTFADQKPAILDFMTNRKSCRHLKTPRLT